VWFVDFGQSFPSLLVLRDRNLLLRKLRYPTVNRHLKKKNKLIKSSRIKEAKSTRQ
jgi:hypothetical protein